MVKDNDSIRISKWMVNKLGLSGNELIVYAVIYGSSHDGHARYAGTLQHLADWCGCSKRTVMRSLESLVSVGLINKYEKELNGMKVPEYDCANISTDDILR